ncbi:hypothetical protein GCM10010517_06620 [Streptosporangium fragile]|uniref:Asp23/Gls24 family envelope stress response protein n=1 Tax=Streptosporangium fragile TaxID=46186 RepID=A0ABN3VQ54_9ACTN
MATPVGHRSAPGAGGATAPSAPGPGGEGAVHAEAGSSAAQGIPAQSVREIVPPERRGRTDIPGRVVSRIAIRSAGEVARVREVGERGPLTFHGGTRATVHGRLAALRLDVTVEYPAPIRQVAQEVRRHVAERVHTLTGLDVGHIDIEVVGVVPARHAASPQDIAPVRETPPERAGRVPRGATAYRETE